MMRMEEEAPAPLPFMSFMLFMPSGAREEGVDEMPEPRRAGEAREARVWGGWRGVSSEG
jgi:hypothetical protein